jgi:hypothetical protein
VTVISQLGAPGTEHPSSFRSSSSRIVGIPKQESRLTEAIVAQSRALLRPGPGRRLLLLEEVEIGIGRPDALLLAVSPSALERRARSGLRLANLTEARVLGARRRGDLTWSGVTRSHAQTVTRSLRAKGWLNTDNDVRNVADVIGSSLLLEAKVSHWTRGIGQLMRVRWASHGVALLVPKAAVTLVPSIALERNGIGLIACDHRSSLQWVQRGKWSSVSWMARLWLTELAVRSLEQGRTYIPSSIANESSDKSSWSTRVR